MNSTLGCSADVRQPQINGFVMGLQDQIERLEMRLANLASQLNPVLRPGEPSLAKDCGEKAPELAPLAGAINSSVRRVGLLDDIVCDLLNRLEV